jgi:hypothetical protein
MRARVLSARIVLLAGLAVPAIAAVLVIAARIGHPYDLEWMAGSVLDHVERVREGKPLYTAPSATWIPFLYPPLYYWLCAVLGGGVYACRLVSLVASIAQGALVWQAARTLQATKFWSAVAVLVFVAAFPFVGFWYDIERSDTLFGAIVLAASVVLLRARSTRGYVAAGALFALATLAKQQALFYLVGAGAGLVLATRAKDAPVRRVDVVAFCATSGVAVLVLVALAYAGVGWAAYYLIAMPRAHGLVGDLARVVIERDLTSGFLLVAVTIVAAVAVALRSFRGTVARADAIAAAILLAGFGGAVASRLHIGGWLNVLIPWTTCAAVAVGVVASRAERRWAHGPWSVIVITGTILVQLSIWRYDPWHVVPSSGSAADEQRLRAEIAELERGGEVLVPSRGHVTRIRHGHISALADVVRVEGHSPPDLVRALRERVYAAIVDDAHEEGSRKKPWPATTLDEVDDLRTPLLSSYFVARQIDYGRHELALASPATPKWVYRPRRVPLDATPAELGRRQLAEMKLARRRTETMARGEPEPFTEAEIEGLAAAP